MEQKEINVYEILKDMPMGTELYSPACGDAELSELMEKDGRGAICINSGVGKLGFCKNGKFCENGEVMLFPSNEMRDWRRFFKRGDVIEYNVGDKHMMAVFDGWEGSSPYTSFYARYIRTGEDEWREGLNCITFNWHKVDWSVAREFIGRIEREYDGRLNLETLEIEKKPAYNFKTFDKVLVRDEEGEEWQPAIYMRASANSTRPYKAFILEEECAGCYACCIPFERHGHLAYTSDPEYTLPF